MAVNAYYKNATVGSAWAGIVALWKEYVPHEDWAWSYEWGVGEFGGTSFLKVKVKIAKPDTDYYYSFIIVNTPVVTYPRGRESIRAVITSPGWSTCAGPVLPTYGARNSLANYEANVHVIKRDLIYYACNINYEADHRLDGGGGYIGSVDFKTWATFYVDWSGPVVLVDQVMVDSTPEYPCVPDADLANPLQVGIPGGSSGGGSVDLAPLVAAVEELALVDTDIEINNGAAMFSVRGKVRT